MSEAAKEIVSQLKEHRILVVDDDETVVQLVTRYLRKRGHTVEMACSGEECLQKLPVFKPEIILLDFNLPGINGLQTLQRIRSEANLSITVVLVTAQTDKDLVQNSLSLGIDDFLVKPFSLEAMASRIEKHIFKLSIGSVREMLRHLPLIDEHLIDQLPFKEGFDKKKWKAYPLLREDIPFAVLILHDQAPNYVAKLSDSDLIESVIVFAHRTHWKQVWPSLGLETNGNRVTDKK